jgi:hypothetical protein
MQMSGPVGFIHRSLAMLAVPLCLFSLVDAAIPQLQMYFLGGQIPIANSVVKAALLIVVVLGTLMHPSNESAGLPLTAWWICAGFLVFEILYLTLSVGLSLEGVLQSYYGYYLLLLLGPAALTFRDEVSGKVIIRCTVFLFLVCAIIGLAQYLTAQPLLYTDSADGGFTVNSWDFFGDVRAFSLFTSSMNFGLFCAFCGALGVALSRTLPIRGALLLIVSTVATFSTLTRVAYLVFVCACTCAFVLTFGRKIARARWHPLLYFALAILIILAGLNSLANSSSTNLRDSSSLIERTIEWGYYYNVLVHSTPATLLFGLGIVQNEKIFPLYPMLIDNIFLALILHIGIIGLLLFGVLLTKMWLYLHREALATQQPFIIAAASLWATLLCAGTFAIAFSTYGTVFTLALFCKRATPGDNVLPAVILSDSEQPLHLGNRACP